MHVASYRHITDTNFLGPMSIKKHFKNPIFKTKIDDAYSHFRIFKNYFNCPFPILIFSDVKFHRNRTNINIFLKITILH